MRWPLRYQIMLPMAAVMLLTVGVVAGLGAWLAVRGTQARIEAQIREVARLVEDSNFPLTTAVLRQMKALSGAELIVVDRSGEVQAASIPADEARNPAWSKPLAGQSAKPEISWTDRLQMNGGSYLHMIVPLAVERGDRAAQLHILYPEDEYRRAWQRAVYPSLGFAALAFPVVVLLAFATGSRIASRVGRLHEQVDRIAGGDFEQFALPAGDDEIRALGEAVNRMARMLANYEQEVRRTERMRTLAHLGGGIAHQLRNSATGCAMAVDLHAEECPLGASETLSVAKRQLRLMEEYVQRFLQLGKPGDATANAEVNLAALVSDLLPLVQPAARHAGVDLQFTSGDRIDPIAGNAERLSQLVINLLLNAIEAAGHGRGPDVPGGRVEVKVDRPSAEWISLTVSDSGPGPAADVQQQLFEPFVTEKSDGVGLGLSVAREIAVQHGGRLEWRRADGMTQFVLDLPCGAGADLPKVQSAAYDLV